jgi:ligand-binding SRPBCC domain-containing protein
MLEGNDDRFTWKSLHTYWGVGFNKCLLFNDTLVPAPVTGTIINIFPELSISEVV